MQGLKNYLLEQEDIETIVTGYASGMQEQLVAGLTGAARSVLISLLQQSLHKPLFIITHQLTQAQKLYEDLLELSSDAPVYLYPVNELMASEIATASPEMRSQRIDSLNRWVKEGNGIFIAPIAACKRILPPPSRWREAQLSFEVGTEIPYEDYLQTLVELGYKREDMVMSPGDFSMRGGIIDIYPLTEENPVRIEMFDEEVESIRYFDSNNQRSLDELNRVVVGPAEEMLLTEEDVTKGVHQLENLLQQTVKKTTDKSLRELFLENIEHDIDRLQSGERFTEMYKYISLFYEEPASLVDYLPKDGLIVFDEMSRIQETVQQLDREEGEWIQSLLEQQKVVRDMSMSFDWHQLQDKMQHSKLYLSVFLRHIPNTQPENIVNFSSRVMQQFHGQMNLLKNELDRWKTGGFSVLIVAPTRKRMEKIQAVLEDYGMESDIKSGDVQLPVTVPSIIKGSISSGFEMPMYRIAVLTEAELFNKKAKRPKRKQKISNAERIKSYQELKVGDYVVHANHGIGKYIGIETLEMNGVHKDYMLINYSGDDKLFVPIDQIDLVQKYVGSEGKEPKIYKLGGSEWKKVKRRVQSSVEDIAEDLIKLYAEREAARGHQYSKDTEMQREFEAAFPYQETEDQIRCIEEIKHDMERPQPMDRLLCGDVGYGKTEVAIRAAFKAVMDEKQVAVLVPTTILAQQHYETFIERFKEFGLNVGLLSRFRTRKQQKETLENLEKGLVDVVIGTHRVLSSDVKFKDLGLLIVDEEQRFGVKHKEKIKQLKTNVDVLTLTATPIPRTLHMSMLGVRDLSVIETPPENRFPIQTYVLEYNPIFIREAIERELARGGQVFFLYNRVENIERVAGEIDQLVEGARVTYAHGQMSEAQLESVMFDFLEGQSDVLVSTTIIETGVDIPNVNTLIVYDADKMGLSQLYQLRGRVGRSNRVAYAYFTYQKDKVLTEVAEKRLQAIKEFTELGSGFKIAMRDLSIRGAGNILGAEQHGFIDSVGFDMYSQMLTDAIEAKKQGKDYEEVKPFQVEMNLDIDAYIPSFYIKDEKQKIDMYKRFQAVQKMDEIYDIKEELLDRFGNYPEEVENLLKVSRIKIYAKREKIESINEQNKKIELLMEESESKRIDGEKLFQITEDYHRIVRLGTENNQLKITFQFDRRNHSQRYDVLETFLAKLENTKNA
ncbi:transcription-repair coupling factor [Salirhabdus salicampi]|uniref:transcription-repair coupling factor n=1 Tax=Salirhabdus salicampi TaxID=476102 RepID=UPI0020C223E4|nr:transcription-repair coupling factor [Salirhabdus salicampi]MCP8618176.1 transcription-repair coupling factor [Salirhabdus salicampi]